MVARRSDKVSPRVKQIFVLVIQDNTLYVDLSSLVCGYPCWRALGIVDGFTLIAERFLEVVL
jgi:hypothetical protein